MPEDVLNSVKTNIHFYIPSSVVTYFKGREALLEELKRELTRPTGDVQKRFVIYGFPGSGKTQFCCKLAQNLRPLFWGIFYIDASSRANAEASLCNIAIQGRVAATKEAAKHFLANAGLPWMLIIDNADDEGLELEDYFPPGERGCILITTRDSDKKHLGTIGSRFCSFERLTDNEAEELLLTTAEEQSPYKDEARREAKKISKTLHCLPLALVLAGQTIRRRYASWIGYLSYFKNNRQALARKTIKRGKAPDKHERERRVCVYVNFEPLLTGMETSTDQAASDAFELMQLFAFLHHRNIRRDILIKAVRNPRIEDSASRAEQEDPNALPQRRSKGWVDGVKQQLLRVAEQLLTNPKYSWLFIQQRTVLPAILRPDALVDGEVDPVRLDQAIYHLQKHSFISPGEEPDTYTVHPLIHEWMRIRLDSPGREAIWCEAAAIVLAKCIILDASSLSPERVAMRTSRHFISTQLLPHIRHVQDCQQSLNDKFETVQQQTRRTLFPMLSNASLTPPEALRIAKFSIVYFQCGEWKVARQLQEQVRTYVIQMRGMDHPACHRITAALSATYYHLDMFPDSIRMMRELVASSKRMYGDDHPQTLKAVDSLAQFLCYSGRLTESLELHTKAWEGFKALKSHGPKHKDSLLALRHLGAVKSRFFCYEESATLCQLALDGLSACNDVEDEILFTKEDLALALAAEKREADRAIALMDEVLERRKIIWGEEGAYTLFAELNYGRVEHSLGRYLAAEARLQRLLPIGIRSVGKTHNAVILGEMFLARSWVGLRRYAEAEELYKRVLLDHAEGGRQKGSDDHVQRILAEWFLVECYYESGKFDEAHDAAENLLDSLAKIGDAGYGLKHPLHGQVVKKLVEIERRMRGDMQLEGG
ncbi:hypothetical protein EJ08DRAFT_599894 [Tothia fuscella]|uniref:NB-ARC domain-containing protein n=1 Tax=Tothia fuscella TaxID=1048955 RepID=A0A9P4NEH8_9PEZI|nr:hypothetical protein EJ08DRAFT_599894 [Tothia fuscella]